MITLTNTPLVSAQIRQRPERASRDNHNLLRADLVQSQESALVRVFWPPIAGLAPEEFAEFALNVMATLRDVDRQLKGAGLTRQPEAPVQTTGDVEPEPDTT
jgi:hypothetical protein